MKNNKQQNRPAIPSRWMWLALAVVVIGLALLVSRNGQPSSPAKPVNSQPAVAIPTDSGTATRAANTRKAVPVAGSTNVKKATSAKPKATATRRANPTPNSNKAANSVAANTVDGLLVRNVKIYDLDGQLAFRGDVDLTATLNRIAKGISDPHRNDGSTFGNFERKLPSKARGYYTEYVLRTKGISGVGPQRVIMGRDGEVYYTPDHYTTFVRVK